MPVKIIVKLYLGINMISVYNLHLKLWHEVSIVFNLSVYCM